MKRVFPALVIAIALTSAAWSNGNQETQPASAENPVELRVMRSVHVTDIPGDVKMNDNNWANIYKDIFPQYDISWEIVPGGGTEYSNKKNLVMASADMPDLIQCTTNDMVLWADQELINPLDDYLDEYASDWLAVAEESSSRHYGMYKGSQYLFISPQNPMQNGRHQFVRQDWLDNLGLKTPNNTDELFAVLKAFTYDDPDGNGEDDTYGMSGMKGLGFMDQCFYPFGVDPEYWSRIDGELIPDIIRPEAKEALAFIKKCWDAGVIEPDALVLSFGDYWVRCRQWYYGYVNFYKNGVINVANPKLAEEIPGAAYTIMNPPLVGPEGEQRLSYGSWNYWSWAIPVTSESPEGAAAVYNYSFTKEGDDFFTGQEGLHYDMVDGHLKIASRSDTNEHWRNNYRLTLSLQHAESADKFAERWTAFANNGMTSIEYVDGINLFKDYGKANPYVVPSSVESDRMPDLETFFEEVSVDIILGNKSLDAFDEWVDYFYANGGKEIIEDVNLKNQ